MSKAKGLWYLRSAPGADLTRTQAFWQSWCDRLLTRLRGVRGSEKTRSTQDTLAADSEIMFKATVARDERLPSADQPRRMTHDEF